MGNFLYFAEVCRKGISVCKRAFIATYSVTQTWRYHLSILYGKSSEYIREKQSIVSAISGVELMRLKPILNHFL
jgi:hypothetical protein